MHYVTSREMAVSISDEITGFFNLPNPSSTTMTLGSTQPLTEMSTRKLPGGKGPLTRKADNLTTICGPIVWKKYGSLNLKHCRSQWPHDVRHEPSLPARTLGLWVRIPLEALMFLCAYSVFVLFCV
jgi:hypothetical protein